MLTDCKLADGSATTASSHGYAPNDIATIVARLKGEVVTDPGADGYIGAEVGTAFFFEHMHLR